MAQIGCNNQYRSLCFWVVWGCADAHVLQTLGPILGLEARNIKQEDGTRANLERVFQAMDSDSSKGITKVHLLSAVVCVYFMLLITICRESGCLTSEAPSMLLRHTCLCKQLERNILHPNLYFVQQAAMVDCRGRSGEQCFDKCIVRLTCTILALSKQESCSSWDK